MKKILFFFVALQAIVVTAQEEAEIPADKAIVYFVRAKSMGALVNFTYFDGDKAIGRFNGPKYIMYECDPGEHVFWARSENRSFVEANLQGGKAYMIEALPRMGGLKAAVKLVPVDVLLHKMKKIQKLLSKKEAEVFSPEELAELQDEMEEVIERGLKKYQEIKEEGVLLEKLHPEMSITLDELVRAEE